MKKTISMIIFSVLLIFSAIGCSLNNIPADENDNEIIVFAASSLLEPLNDISLKYKEKAPNVSIVYNFDSSGTLKTQIESGAQCDLFLSANKKSVDDLDNLSIKYRKDLLKNEVVLVVSDSYDGVISSFDDLVDAIAKHDILLAIGNSEVPVGDYTLLILESLGVTYQELIDSQCVTFCSSAKEVVTQIKEDAVDCAIVYMTDAQTSDLDIVDIASSSMCGEVLYPCVLFDTLNGFHQVKDFYDFLSSDVAYQIFEKYGFTPVA
ncbi:MAG: molybdate ABC transporter substrate-binding protein [Ruminococcaceae bacterium]|nr:molybdate ABC transporter substrate-binding protein [Oscillospiraceae bacterium]